MNVQARFFQNIRSSIPQYHNLAQRVSEVLEISLNESYKKIKGISQLNVSQIEVLCKTFNVAFNCNPNATGSVSFSYQAESLHHNNIIKNYLDSLLMDLKAWQTSPRKHLILATEEVPIFYLFKYPELAVFKLLFWQNSLSSINPACIDSDAKEELTNKMKDINLFYSRIPSTEIWSKNSVQNTLEQIRYLWEAGIIEDSCILTQIIAQLINCLEDINLQAITCKKEVDSNYQFGWYCCDIIGCVAYLAEVDKKIVCYNKFNTFEYLKTYDMDYCYSIKSWTERLIKKSTCFSGQSEKYRNKFISKSIVECKNFLKESIGVNNPMTSHINQINL